MSDRLSAQTQIGFIDRTGCKSPYFRLACGLVFLVLMVFFVSLAMGCKMEKSWVDEMLHEMEVAWVDADKAHLGQDGRNAAVTAVVQKHFRPGMAKIDAFGLLRELKEQGFNIGEYRHEGARDWPDGEIKPYLDEDTRRNLQSQIPPGVSRITARKQYGRVNFVVLKHGGVTVIVHDKENFIISSYGSLGSTSAF